MSCTHKRRARDPENIILHGRLEIGALERWFTPFERKVRRLSHLSYDAGVELEPWSIQKTNEQLASFKEALMVFRSEFDEREGVFQLLRGRPEFDELWNNSELLKTRVDTLEQQFIELLQRVDTAPTVQRRHV